MARFVERARSIQFSAADEQVGQIFHELMLIPSAYFRPDRVLIHASAFQAPSGKVIAIGGTGGVGKTSLELALCLHGDFRFVTDDICVLSESGHVWPILAPPKIYGYNTEHDRELRRKVLERRSSIDRLHWRWRSRRGSDRVRRRAPVDELYSSFSTAGGRGPISLRRRSPQPSRLTSASPS
jgi:hypothetical protein